ncbi:MAG TPA: helix-turn-helix transcriptional regulator [Chryseolinea sp.]|nr:helix-turn-helix transcriptional regulator [Chryseolinea sp.]
MKSKKTDIRQQFVELVANDTRDYKFEELMLSMRVLSEVERLMEEKNMNKNALAIALGVSAPYVTMLFQGEKVLNLDSIARIQEIFNVDFRIKAEYRDPVDVFETIHFLGSIEETNEEIQAVDKPKNTYAVSKNSLAEIKSSRIYECQFA